MTNIKMVVTDLDSTLLRSDKTVSEYTLNILSKLRKQGILFVISTARPVYVVKEALSWLTYDAASYQNGGIVYKGDQNIANYSVPNSYNMTKDMLKDNPDLHLVVVAHDTLYANLIQE